MNYSYVLILILSYFIGALPFGYIFSKLKGVDITSKGSGSVGATNVARNLGKKAGILILALDILKGYLPLYLLSQHYCFSLVCLAGFFLVLGHCFSVPPFLKGGKGVATATGVLSFLSPACLLFSGLVFLLTFKLTKYVSLSSIIASLSFPLFVYLTKENNMILFTSLCIATVIIQRHHENISRLLNRQESQFKI